MRNHPLKSFQLSNEILEQISRFKRKTGISKNNVICRWAFYYSISLDGSPLLNQNFSYPEGGKGEISWEVFGGEQSILLSKLLTKKCMDYDRNNPNINQILKDTLLSHIYRGLNQLLSTKKINSISDLIKTIL